MFCGKCGHMIEDSAKFCPFCGYVMQQQEEKTVAVENVQPVDHSYRQPYPQPNYHQPAGSAPYAQPAYQPAGSAPYAQPAVIGVPASGSRINKAGHILAVILSAAAMGLWLLTLVEDVRDLIDGFSGLWLYMDFAYLLFCFIPLFIFCLNLKKLNPMMLGFTFTLIVLYRIFGVIASLTNIEIFGSGYNYDVIDIVFVAAQAAGIVLYIVATAMKKDLLVLKIISAVLLGATAVFEFYECFTNTFGWFMDDPMYVIGYFSYAFACACAFAALIVVLFTSKKQVAAAPAPAAGYAPAAAPVSAPFAPAAPAASPAPAPAVKPVSNAVDTLRVYLDIDKLDSGVYGHKAGLVIAQAVSADLLEGMTIESGDSRATLYGNANEYVVSIRGRSSALDEIEAKMRADAAFEGYLSPTGLKRGSANEPLVGDGTVRGGALTGGGFSWCAKGMEEGWKK